MTDKNADKEMKAMDAVTMMVDSISTDLVIKKRPGDEFSINGRTGVAIVDLYIILKGFGIIIKEMKPMFTGKEDVKKCFSEMVCTIIDEVYEGDEKKDEENEK